MTTSHFSLEEAKEWLRERVAKGESCPCCGQFAKVYRRKLNTSMALALVKLHRYTSPGEWVHLFRFLSDHSVQHSDAALLRWWDLIEEKPETKDDGNPRAGFYRITSSGRQFADGSFKVERRAKLYNTRCMGFDGGHIGVREALGDKFNYDELMST